MIVLVIGGAGYIGSHAARSLRQHGHEVQIYDNLSTGHTFLADGFELIVGDASDSDRLAQVLRRVDAVMHFAAHSIVSESVADPRKYFQNNVQGGIRLLNAALDAGVRMFVFSSTAAIYGIPDTVPITEGAVCRPVNPYGSSKLFFENALQAYSQAYGLRFASLRYFNAAGADESGQIGELHSPETHLIPSALEAVAGARLQLDVYGVDYPTSDGTCIRDYVHVSDLAEAHVLALEYLAKGGDSVALNLGTGQGQSVKQVLETVEEVTGHKVPQRISARRPGDPPILVADPRRAEGLLRWKATRSLTDMIASAWKWMQCHGKVCADSRHPS